ncbi:MAG: P1 family peptidase [Gemmatimonadaceae bacterium]|nr:P1 family peptidase [Gemmatimonadaceae bacterium]
MRNAHVRTLRLVLIIGLVAGHSAASAQPRPREHDLRLPIGGAPGPLNAITDVAGVEVGHTTLIAGSGPLVVGKGPVRTGVTVVLPRGRNDADPVFASWFTLNGNGEMTGTTWIQESGYLEGPVAITNTHSVGVVRDAIIKWEVSRKTVLQPWWLPVVAETYDGGLNDINGFHVKESHVIAALDSARGGPVREGVVGGGTGMVCLGFKGGIGTASRVLTAEDGGYTVGVLVQCNFGSRRDLRIAGAPVGEEITGLDPCIANTGPVPAASRARRLCSTPGAPDAADAAEQGSIIVVVATDAPLLPHQLKRIATRVSLGIGRQGGFGGNGSGDIFVAFSTANAGVWSADSVAGVRMVPNDALSALFKATTQATEAAITNALLAAETTTGADDLRVFALPVDRMLAALRKYGRVP